MGTLIQSKSLLREFEKKIEKMKFLPLICIAHGLPVETHEDVVVPDVDYYTNSCQAKINDIERSLRSSRSNWTKKSTPLGDSIYQKKHCKRLTYDMQFCTMVCGLHEGASCQTDPSEGEDICDQGLYCNSGTCESLSADYSSFDYSDWYENETVDVSLTKSRRKNT